MNSITSRQNPLIKEVKALAEKKHREERKIFLVEGIRFVEEALKENVKILNVLVSDQLALVKGGEAILKRLEEKNLEVSCLPHKLFCEVADTETPQGIIAVIGMREHVLEEVLDKHGIFLILEAIQDPGNMGTIIRTADAAGVLGIIASRGCVDLYNSKVLRSTMGSIFRLPVFTNANLEEEIVKLKAEKIKIYASHIDGRDNHFDVSMDGGVGIVIGNEANGISSETAALADRLIKIPMPGNAESLNASIAAGILVYEAVRQRLQKPRIY